MIFLDFLWLFIFMVLIDSRPMLKSMHDENNLKDKVVNKGHVYISEDNHDAEAKPITKIISKKPKIKRKLINEEIDLTKFRTVFNDHKNLIKHEKLRKSYRISNKNVSNILETLTTEIGSLKRLYGLNDTPQSTLIEDVPDTVTQRPKEITVFGGAAEIEAALNEIKQKSIQMMVEQLPSITEIITSTVTQTAFDVRPVAKYSGLKSRYKKACQNSNLKTDIRSLKCDAVTLANKVENMLQKKLKKTYCKYKHKISSDFKNEINQTRNTIKFELNRFNNAKHKICKSKKTKCHHTLSQLTSKKQKLTTNKKYSTKKYSNTKNLFTIPKATDDYSMLSMYEQFLLKSHDNTVLDKLVTPNDLIKERMCRGKLSKRNLAHHTDDHNLKKDIEKSYQDDEIPDVADYSEEDLSSSEATTTDDNLNSSSTTNDISMGALSNKISYNDYVNGFKHYLNFQKEQDNEKFSNLVRYQAHKHHNVDDVGKYILNKIPQLPSTRSRRYFFEQETLEDQDISTKSEDSWFKKHFYLFIDKDPPKKFHTAQTVSFKSCSNKPNSTNVSTRKNYTTSTSSFDKNLIKSKRAASRIIYLNTKHSKARSVANNFLENKVFSTRNDKHAKKNGYVDVTMIHKPAGIVKLENKKNKHKLRIFDKFTLHKKHTNNNKKREILSRKTRFNPFKGLKGVFKNRLANTNTAVPKIFDYEVITSSLIPFRSLNFDQNPNIEDMLRQVPNITGNMESSFDFDENEHLIPKNIMSGRKYLHNDGFYNLRPRNYYEMNRFSILPENRVEALEKSLKQHKIDNNNYYTYYVDNNKRFDDVINVRIKTDTPIQNLWNMTLPTFSQENINNDKDKLAVSINYLGDDPSKQLDFITGNGLSNNLGYENAQAYFTKQIKDNNDINNIYQKYYQNVPFRLDLQKSTFNAEMKGENRDKFKEKNNVSKIIAGNKSISNNHLTTVKDMTKNFKLYNVKLFKNSLITESSNLNSACDTKKIESNVGLIDKKGDLLQLNLRTQNRMQDQNKAVNSFNVLNRKNEFVQRNIVKNYMPVKLHLSNKFTTKHKKYIEVYPRGIDKDDDIKAISRQNVLQRFNDNSKVQNRQYSVNSKIHKEMKHSDIKLASISTKNENKKIKSSTDLKTKSSQFTKPYIWNSTGHNKNKLLLHNHREFQNGPQTQLNKVPEQYFATPLPMQADNFDRFLKEHQMDVKSVTAPLSDITSNKNFTMAKTLQVTKHLISDTNKIIPDEVRNKNINGNMKSKQKYYERRKQREYIKEKHGITTSSRTFNKKNNKIKRDIKQEHTFTAKDVAALEIVIDLRKNDQAYNEKESSSTRTESNGSINSVSNEKQTLFTNSIQVHIALPGNADNRKRSAESIQVRKVFSAKLASPVDIEYQIHSFENKTSLPTTISEDQFSPGIYLLIENTNSSDPLGKLILKPITFIEKSDERIRKYSNYNTGSYALVSSTNPVASYKTEKNTKIEMKRTIKDHKSKRYIKWDAVKNFFGHDRICKCRCKANRTMCKPCAACDIVISELVFELDNLAKYMQDHCTEIQTFFWMNPSGGKKLREVVNKIDKSLNNYYKRVKGKCQGRTCKMFSSGIDKKRSQRQTNNNESNYNITSMLKNLSKLADNLENANIIDLFNLNVQYYGQNLMDIINVCMPKMLKKRSNMDENKQIKKLRSVYSLDNVNVNLICSPKQQTPDSVESTSSLYYNFALNNNPSINSFDYESGKYKIKEQTIRRGVSNFLKRRFHTKKYKDLSSRANKKQYFKNMNNFEQSTLLPEATKLFWQDNINRNNKQYRSKRKINKVMAPIVKVFVKGTKVNNTKTSSKIGCAKTKSKTDLNEIKDMTTEAINLNQLLNTDYSTKNLSLMQNMNALFNLLGTNVYDSFTPKLDISKTKRKKSGHKKVIDGKQKKLLNISHKTHTTKSFLESDELKRDDVNAINPLRNVTRHFISTHFKILDPESTVENRRGRNITFKYVTQKSPRMINPFTVAGTFSDVITSMTTKDSPTIIIIDDNNNYSKDFSFATNTQKNKETNEDENIRSLLLSILNFNSKVLNDEWVRASKSNHAKTLGNLNDEFNENTIQHNYGLKDSFASHTLTTFNGKRGLFDKIAHKFSWNHLNSSNKHEKHATEQPNTKLLYKTEPNSKRFNNVTDSLRKTSKKLTKPTDETTPLPVIKTTKKIGDKRVSRLCDISSTIAHVLSVQKTMNKSNFEKYVKNLNCYKYKTIPAHFFIKTSKGKKQRIKKRRNICNKVELSKIRPSWRKCIETKREVARVDLDDDYDTGNEGIDLSEYKSDIYVSRQKFAYKLMDEGPDIFEKYKIRYQGIYVPMARNKRNTDVRALERGLTNLPAITPLTDEVFVMVGDPFATDCCLPGYSKRNASEYIWKTDRKMMLNIGNVFINGSKIFIQNVQKRNYGTYTCYRDNVISRSVKLNVIDLPNFNVVFAPVYRTLSSSCTYNDLRAIKNVGVTMRNLLCGDYCTIRIDEPVCLRDRVDNSCLIRTTSVIVFDMPFRLSCTAECRRDFKCSMALLIARNVPALTYVPVIMLHNEGSLLEEIKTWEPSFHIHKNFVTHTLRKKDSNGHFEYHTLASSIEPASVHVIVLCPAGFFLVPAQKICNVCPSGTYSSDGTNVCVSCPKGWTSGPGSPSCPLSLQRLRHSTLHWEPYLLVIFVMSCFLILCHGVIRVVRNVAGCSKKWDEPEAKKIPRRTKAYRSLQNRPVSPSRVIINKLLRVSSIPHATDSQKTRMKIWKEENAYPPLPPIDFDS